MIKSKYRTREDKLGEIVYNKQGTPMKLVAYRGMFDVDIEFQDEYKYIIEHAVYNNFKKGQIKNPYDKTVCGMGMLGVGKYRARLNDKRMFRDYQSWMDILIRCYKDNGEHPAYYGLATVCDEWLNFQNYAKWYEENHYEIPNGERLHIDKDILVPGNKIYSSYTCIFVPHKINMLFMNKTNLSGLPNGLHQTPNGKYSVSYNGKHLGCYVTVEEAYSVYAKEKEKAIMQIAEKYKKYIPEKLYEALYRFEVKLENDKNYKVNGG